MLRRPRVCCLAVILALIPNVDEAAEFVLDEPGAAIVTDNGVIALEWAPGSETEAIVFELEESTVPDLSDAEIIYRGADRSTHITGLREGDYFFRVREGEDGTWSDPLTVRVEFIGRGKLFALLGVGFLVCFLTAATIITGHFKRREN